MLAKLPEIDLSQSVIFEARFKNDRPGGSLHIKIGPDVDLVFDRDNGWYWIKSADGSLIEKGDPQQDICTICDQATDAQNDITNDYERRRNEINSKRKFNPQT